MKDSDPSHTAIEVTSAQGGATMTAATSATIDKDVDQDREVRPSAAKSIPADCNPDQYLDWRLRLGKHLAEQTDERPIKHDDPWVQEAVNFFITCRDHDDDHEPPLVHLAIAEAVGLSQADTLERHVLEARLLAQQTPDEIYRRCQFSLTTITAYAMLLFDVRGHERMRVWFRRRLATPPVGNLRLWQLTVILKNTGAFDGTDALEKLVDCLCRLEGPTLADGLPDRADPAIAEELLVRQKLAGPLLPRTRTMQKLMEQFGQAVENDLLAGRSSAEGFAAGIAILSKAKIPVALRKEIEKLRRHCSEASASTVNAEPAGDPMEGPPDRIGVEEAA
jgi:hypothetical protein